MDAEGLITRPRKNLTAGYALSETVWVPGAGPGVIVRFFYELGAPVRVRVRVAGGDLDLPLDEIQPRTPDLHSSSAVRRWLER